MTRFKVENRINAIDFGDVLEELGYIVNDETGEIYTPADHHQFFNAQRFLLMHTILKNYYKMKATVLTAIPVKCMIQVRLAGSF